MLDRVGILIAVAALTAGNVCASSTASAQNLQAVSVIAFPGTGNWPIRIAQEKGYFAQAGIEVNLTPTPNSVFQMTNLIDGKFDIGMTAVDNVIAYAEGQGEVAVSREPDLFVFMGGSPSIPVLVTIPEVKTTQELKGKTLAVDAITTGYAFVLFGVAQRIRAAEEDAHRSLSLLRSSILRGGDSVGAAIARRARLLGAVTSPTALNAGGR